jgi:hypothetical protein
MKIWRVKARLIHRHFAGRASRACARYAIRNRLVFRQTAA